MSTWFHHPGLVVPDLDAAAEFYCDALGYAVIRDYNWELSESDTGEKVIGIAGTSARCRLLKGENGFMELFEYQTPEPTGNPSEKRACDFGIAHLGFQVTDIDAAYRRFVDAGGVVHNTPVPVGKGYSIYCRDPFGNIIELMQLGADEPDFDLVEEQLLPPQARP